MCVVNMKIPKDALIQQIFRHIHDIQNIYAIKHAWEIFNIHTIVFLDYKHLFPFHDTFTIDIEGHGNALVQQIFS